MKKISKPTARKLFNSGRTIYLMPSKARMGGMWIKPMPINKRKGSFTKLVNSFEYYNCNAPFGKYAWFYTK
jgi:hypothetical protein